MVFTGFTILAITIEALYAITGNLAAYQRISTDQLALTITHDASNLVSNYETTAGKVVNTIPPSVQSQISTAMTQELGVMQGTGSVTCKMASVASVSCAVSYRAPADYLALGGAISHLISTTTVVRTASLVTFGGT